MQLVGTKAVPATMRDSGSSMVKVRLPFLLRLERRVMVLLLSSRLRRVSPKIDVRVGKVLVIFAASVLEAFLSGSGCRFGAWGHCCLVLFAALALGRCCLFCSYY
jgi:hypothetical protein